ncbi:MAG: hypothetical protein OEN01_13650 [Candidatus Krumholzibacteria bacterium]|nr:hypothetical protein [Candidatus Krumholzibacteria bacterium]
MHWERVRTQAVDAGFDKQIREFVAGNLKMAVALIKGACAKI